MLYFKIVSTVATCNVIGNTVAAIVVAKFTGEFDPPGGVTAR